MSECAVTQMRGSKPMYSWEAQISVNVIQLFRSNGTVLLMDT